MNFLNNLSLTKIIGLVSPLIAIVLSFNTLVGVYKGWQLKELNGSWKIITITDHSTKNSYVGLRLGYNVHIEQNGEVIKGKGEKYYEYDNLITNFSDHTPIEFSGKLAGNEINLTFTEKGRLRETNGSFRFRDEDGDGTFEGTFYSTNADRKGKCILVQEK